MESDCEQDSSRPFYTFPSILSLPWDREMRMLAALGSCAPTVFGLEPEEPVQSSPRKSEREGLGEPLSPSISLYVRDLGPDKRREWLKVD